MSGRAGISLRSGEICTLRVDQRVEGARQRHRHGISAVLVRPISPAHSQPATVTKLVTHDDVTIEALVQGSGQPIVILPSLGRGVYGDYEGVAKSLVSSGFKVVHSQPRGMGKSVGPMDGVTFKDFALDVVTVIDRLANGRAVVVGRAYGHFVARMTATLYPDRVRGVVIASATASDTRTRFPEAWAAPEIASDPTQPAEKRLAALQRVFFAPGNDATIWLNGWHPDAAKSQLAAIPRLPQSVWWAAGNAPLLDIIPAEDPFMPKDLWDELKQAFDDRVTVVVIPHASHALFPEQPAAVAAAIAQWVSKLPQ